jgi:hypothetical protein
MMVDPNKRFIEDRTTPVTEFGGFLSIPMSAIQCKEWKMPQTKKDLVKRELLTTPELHMEAYLREKNMKLDAAVVAGMQEYYDKTIKAKS